MFRNLIWWLLRKRTSTFKTSIAVSDVENTHLIEFGGTMKERHIKAQLAKSIADNLLERDFVKITSRKNHVNFSTIFEAEIRVIK